MNVRRVVTFAFDNHLIHAFDLDGAIAFLADEIGAALGYAGGGRRLATRLQGELRRHLDARDLVTVDGTGLVQLRVALLDAPNPPDLSSCERVALLLEPGLRKVLDHTERRVAAQFRAFLDREVIPTFRRVAVELVPSVRPHRVWAAAPSARMVRERRLLRRVELDDRRFRAAALRETTRALNELGVLDAEFLARCEITVAEIALGRPLAGLRSTLHRAFPEYPLASR